MSRLLIFAMICLLSCTAEPVTAPEQPAQEPNMSSHESETPQFTNRLIDETSPYLLQHAHNPVDWYPWGEEAFELAKKLDKPIFLSVGYSACHWCHVMEHESFEDPEIAKLMNEWFVCIKVDREERPDVDEIYMTAVQLITQRGGWPMSVFLTPDKEPFYGGTYWPPTSRQGMTGFVDILTKIREIWDNRRDEVETSADQLVEAIQQISQEQAEASALNEGILEVVMKKLIKEIDQQEGGFGYAPKFPHTMDLQVMMRCAKRFNNQEALNGVALTLDKMAAGGIYDHLGGGFARYSTDREWLAPHFEKMLYDNALLVPVYLEAYQLTKNEDYVRVVEETLDYVIREMQSPEGGYYSTQDADSEGEEGKFYVWQKSEIDSLLPADDAKLFAAFYDVTPSGNWEHKTILRRVKTIPQIAKQFQLSESEVSESLARSRQKLFEVRSQRIWPGRDEKILTSWNGLMITAMAQASLVMQEEKYLQSAQQAADFLLSTMKDDQGHLLHSYKDGRPRFNGYLDDYSFLIHGLVELFQASGKTTYLISADELTQQMISRFHDSEQGGFYYTSHDHEELIARSKDAQDNATPSGTNVATTALLKLGLLTTNTTYEDIAEATLKLQAEAMANQPLANGQALMALNFFLGPTQEFVLAGSSHDVEKVLFAAFLPNKLFLSVDRLEGETELISTLIAGKSSEGSPTLYICERGQCEAPLTGMEAIQKRISQENLQP